MRQLKIEDNTEEDRFSLEVYPKMRFNTKMVEKCINDISVSDGFDRESYYHCLVTERLDKCNDDYTRDFDKELSEILSSIDDQTSMERIGKLIKYSSKLTSGLFDRLITLTKNFIKKSN